MKLATCAKKCRWRFSGCNDVAARFALELAQSGLMYSEGDFSAALPMVETALRTGLRTSDDTRGHLTYQWRCDVLTMVDRLDESLEMSTAGRRFGAT